MVESIGVGPRRHLVAGIVSALGAGLLLAAPAASGPREASVPRWEPVEPGAFPVSIPKDRKVETGYLVVREDRSKPNGRTIRLPVAIVRTRNPSPAPDPVVYTAGGPGSSTLSAVPYVGAYRFSDTRDMIFFEQRGTRLAQPTLECPEVVAAKLTSTRRGDVPEARMNAEVAAAAACAARLEQAGIDRAAYTTAASVADLEDLRRVLGVRQWNLYGVSYSTRLMLEVLRTNPTSVRSVVLDSPLPPSERYHRTAEAHVGEAWEAVFRACEAQAACREAYPNLKSRLSAALQEARRSPVRVAVKENGATTDLTLGPAELVRLIDTGDTWSLPSVPRLMDQIARRDATALGRAAERLLSPSEFAWGMRYSVWCGEENDRGRRAPSRSFPMLRGLVPDPVPAAVCQAWGVPRVPKAQLSAVRSQVPTLIVAGDFDPYTPPSWARLAARSLPNSRVVTLPMGHTPTQVWDQPCAMNIAASFMNAPGQNPAQQPCLADARPPRFP